MKFFSLAVPILCLAAFPLAVRADLPDPATKNKVPPIAFVQARIWERLNLADFTLNGRVHSDKLKQSYPMQLLTKGHELVYKFLDQPLQIRVLLDPGSFSVATRKSDTGSWTPVSNSEMSQAIFGSDITYGDLALDFVNWDDIQPLGTDSIKTLDCYVFEAKPGPSDHSPFASIRFWVSSQYWAFLRIDGVNAKGETVKRVEVQDVMKIGKFTVFKQMKVSHMDPQRNDIAQSTTFIDIDGGNEGSGLTDAK